VQGIEYLTTGRITLPIPEPALGDLQNIRTGTMKEADALMYCADIEDKLKTAVAESPLPPKPNLGGVGMWLADVYGINYQGGRNP